MVAHRLFVGNLPDTVTGPEVSSKFAHFGTVQSAEVKTKNDATFAFVSLLVEDERKLRQCIDVLNNTKWRGNLIKVQAAKESFLDKLKREQAENREREAKQVSVISFEDDEEGNEGRGKHMYIPRVQPATSSTAAGRLLAMATGSGSGSTGSKNQNQVNVKTRQSAVTKSKPESDGDSSDDSDEENAVFRPPPFRGLGAYPELKNPVISQTESSAVKNIEIKSKPKEPEPLKNNVVEAADPKSASPEGDGGLIKLQEKLLAIAGAGAATGSYNRRENRLPPRSPHQVQGRPAPRPTRQAELEVVSVPTPSPGPVGINASNSANPTPLNFKKRNSDLIRQKSLETRQNLIKSRSDIIKSSLLNINIQPPVHEKPDGSSKNKKGSDNLSSNLFDDDQEDTQELASQFKLKPQFEGESGERNLELSSKFSSYDSRFVIDERFRDEAEGANGKEDENDETVNLEKEKLSHFSILSDVLGTRVASEPQPSNSKSKPSCIVQRYDPENDTSGDFQNSLAKKRKKGEIESNNANNSIQAKANDVEAEKEEPKIATYHVASNLKDLFSSDSAQPSFSLLQTFAPSSSTYFDDTENYDESSTKKARKTTEKSTKAKGSTTNANTNQGFWQPKNPFKYDSSDSEEEEDTTDINGGLQPSKKARKDTFFFKRNDKRFQGLEEYFLKNDENMDDVVYRFNNGERQELRLICRGKIKNTKRKSEKRIESLRRYKRKIKAQRKDKYAPQGSNAVPVGPKA